MLFYWSDQPTTGIVYFLGSYEVSISFFGQKPLELSTKQQCFIWKNSWKKEILRADMGKWFIFINAFYWYSHRKTLVGPHQALGFPRLAGLFQGCQGHPRMTKALKASLNNAVLKKYINSKCLQLKKDFGDNWKVSGDKKKGMIHREVKRTFRAPMWQSSFFEVAGLGVNFSKKRFLDMVFMCAPNFVSVSFCV